MAAQGPKMVHIRVTIGIFMIKAIYELIFNGPILERGWNGKRAIQAEQFDQFARLKIPYMWFQGGQNRLLIAFGPHKSAQSAYFGLEGVEKDGLQHVTSRMMS